LRPGAGRWQTARFTGSARRGHDGLGGLGMTAPVPDIPVRRDDASESADRMVGTGPVSRLA